MKVKLHVVRVGISEIDGDPTRTYYFDVLDGKGMRSEGHVITMTMSKADAHIQPGTEATIEIEQPDEMFATNINMWADALAAQEVIKKQAEQAVKNGYTGEEAPLSDWELKLLGRTPSQHVQPSEEDIAQYRQYLADESEPIGRSHEAH